MCKHNRLCSASDPLSDRNCDLQSDRKSQLQNKEKAFRLLRSKLYELELENSSPQKLRREEARLEQEIVLRRSELTTSRRDV